MIEKILKDLNDLGEMLKCRRLNKRCKQIVDKIRITGSLAVEGGNRSSSSRHLRFDVQRYEFTSKLIGPMSVLFRTENFNLMKCKFMLKMISRLRMLAIEYLSIRTIPQLNQFQSSINQLKALEHLQIGTLSLSRPRTLRLDHVRRFALMRTYTQSLVLTAPKLTHLAELCGQPNFELTTKDRLTHLTLFGYEANLLDNCATEQIEYLRFDGRMELATIQTIIRNYTALRELHIKLMNRSAVCEILKQRKIARNLNLVIYFSGFRIDDLGDVEQLFGDEAEVKSAPYSFMVANFERFHLVDYVKLVSYSKLIKQLDGQLTFDEFFSKFIRIEQVTVGRFVDSQPNLIAFLKKCKLLNKLTITNSPLNQMFYDKLHTFCGGLETLKIEMLPRWVINMNFLLEHVQLKTLAINQKLNFAIVSSLFQQRARRSFSLEFLLNTKLVRLNQGYNDWTLHFDGISLAFRNWDNQYLSPQVALKSLFELVLGRAQ